VSDDPRPDPPAAADERPTLTSFLDFLRGSVTMKVAGLSDDDARRTPLPTGTTLLGIVRHLAGVEHWWFRRVFAAEVDHDLYDDPDPDRDWHIDPGDTMAEALAAYDAQCARAREITAAAPSLDQLSAWAPSRGAVSLRWILVHMIEETGRHAGHADILRELIDGVTGE
jgi:uncharacterized damage-inducible protein DinB